jgi:hypothetical protein
MGAELSAGESGVPAGDGNRIGESVTSFFPLPSRLGRKHEYEIMSSTCLST